MAFDEKLRESPCLFKIVGRAVFSVVFLLIYRSKNCVRRLSGCAYAGFRLGNCGNHGGPGCVFLKYGFRSSLGHLFRQI